MNYALHGRKRIAGWFSTLDAQVFLAVDALQQEMHVAGDLLEVGAYVGKSAILLGYFLRPEENLVVVDLFGEASSTVEQRAEQERWYGQLTRSRFEANYRRFHPALPTVRQGRSDEVLPGVADGSCRFVHLDGAHEFEAVRADTKEALRVASSQCVIAFDDVLSAHTPGVTASAWEAVVDGRLVPLVQTTKLYATVPGSSMTADRLAEHLRAIGVDVIERHSVLGHPVLEVGPARRRLGPAIAAWLAAEAVPPGAARLLRHLRQRAGRL